MFEPKRLVPVAMITPPVAGPITRAPLKAMELSAMALGSSSRGTRSAASAWRTGMSSALTTPSAKESTITVGMLMLPVTVSASSRTTCSVAAVCVARMARRLSIRSTTTPPNGASTSAGTNSSAATMPSWMGDPPSSRTSHGSEICCIQVPIRLTPCPIQ